MEKQKTIELGTRKIIISYSCGYDFNSEKLDILNTNQYYNSDIVNCVSFVKTVIPALISLTVTFESDSVKEAVTYENKELVRYSLTVALRYPKEKSQYEIEGFSIKYTKDSLLDIKNFNALGKTVEEADIYRFVNTLIRLKKTKKVSVDSNDEKLITAYTNLHNTMPDFTSEKDLTELQYLAIKNNICSSYFTPYPNNEPRNLLVSDMCDKLQVIDNKLYKKRGN